MPFAKKFTQLQQFDNDCVMKNNKFLGPSRSVLVLCLVTQAGHPIARNSIPKTCHRLLPNRRVRYTT